MRTVTQWFDMTESPVRFGKYEVRFKFHGRYSKPVKVKFTEWGWNISGRYSLIPSELFGDQWRGLAEEPKK